jgi:hypothetical protein
MGANLVLAALGWRDGQVLLHRGGFDADLVRHVLWRLEFQEVPIV